ncbi:MAG TPA: integrase arm-type DNA-binding domain-containing protein [Stellaceae bacterium]|nr:integrase arm-type DNA-binding domain-containing protein [Stellaceae bacterium]
MSLSDRAVAALKPPEKGQKVYPDKTIPGFGVRVSQGGTKTFILIVGETRRRITIGRYPVISLLQAREKAKTLLARRQLGLDKPQTPKFEEVLEEYLAYRDTKVRPATRTRDHYLFPHFKGLSGKRLADITPQEVQEILDQLQAEWTRRGTLERFSNLIKFAQKQGHAENWPLHRLEASVTHVPRERVLTDDELAKILSTARIWRQAGNQFADIISLLVFSGQRRQQIGSLHRSHIDFHEGTITWPPELMKAGRKHVIPMGNLVRAILEPRGTNGLFYPNLHGDPFSAWSIHVRKFTRDVGFGDWVLHDLRRTLATRWQEMGIEIATTEKMLSHSAITGGLVGVYQRSTYLTQMKAAVHLWENYLHNLLPT